MSWNRPARALVVCAALASVLTLAGCGKKSQPALTGDPDHISTTTTAPVTTSTAAGAASSTTSTTAAK